jgi:Flp pilus assembly pilin Flp
MRNAHESKKPALLRDERGLSTVEYVIILALIAIGGITIWGQFGDAVASKVGDATTRMENLGQETPGGGN